MRINELCESIDKELEKTPYDPEDPHGLGFDIREDLAFFMNNDDSTYRRHTFPTILKVKDLVEAGKQTDYKLFEKTVKDCYNIYQDTFKGHKLPETLDQTLIDDVARKLHDEELDRIKNGEYKG